MNSLSKTQKKKKSIHWRSLIIAFLFVFVPWCLIAIPGANVGNDYGIETYRIGAPTDIYLPMNHGWPAVHMVSMKSSQGQEMFGDFESKLKRYDRKAKLVVNSHHREFVAPGMATQFWSDINRWPGTFSNVGVPVDFEYRLNTGGLVINIGFLMFLILLVILFCELRIRRFGKLFRFSIFECLVLFLLVAAGLGWVGMHNQRAHKESTELKHLEELVAGTRKTFDVFRYDPLPAPISRVFDYVGQLPFLHADTFRPIRKVQLHRLIMKPPSQGSFDLSDSISADTICGLDLPWSLKAKSTDFISTVTEANIYEFELVAMLSNNNVDLDALQRLKRLRRLELNLTITSPDAEFDWSSVDCIAGLEECKLTLRFPYSIPYSSKDWPAKHVLAALKLNKVDEFSFFNLKESTLKELVKFPVKDKLVFIDLKVIKLKNSQLAERLIDAGYVDLADRVRSPFGF